MFLEWIYLSLGNEINFAEQSKIEPWQLHFIATGFCMQSERCDWSSSSAWTQRRTRSVVFTDLLPYCLWTLKATKCTKKIKNVFLEVTFSAHYPEKWYVRCTYTWLQSGCIESYCRIYFVVGSNYYVTCNSSQYFQRLSAWFVLMLPIHGSSIWFSLDGMIISHLPFGPTTYFSLSNTVMRHDIPDVGKMSEAFPHLIFHNFKSKLGERVRSPIIFI